MFKSTEKIKADHPELPAYEEFDELLAKSDIVSVHAPLTEQTEGLMNAEAIF